MKKEVKNLRKSVVGSIVENFREGDGAAKKKVSPRYKRNDRHAVEEALETSGDFMLVSDKFGKTVVYYAAIAA